ncbi:unnamed protein product [Protopolystoma xenopodis]|uniref:Uncharacterized protein n=1 Tax=Protopolystoma xenopodis TaxID=117903 RepID=A0A3S5CIX8_9PLAT|nr:unnamed protein product [Protopolystoma xenopodis]
MCQKAQRLKVLAAILWRIPDLRGPHIAEMECANEWLQEIEDYKSQMTEYFTKCSAKLKEWYDNGGDRSDTYRVEYNKLMDEYDKYTRYLEGLHRSSLETQAAPGSDSQESRSSVLTSGQLFSYLPFKSR